MESVALCQLRPCDLQARATASEVETADVWATEIESAWPTIEIGK